MDERTTRLAFGIFNILAVTVILTDLFLLLQKELTISITGKTVEKSYNYGRSSHLTYFLIDDSGKKYNVSPVCYHSTGTGAAIIYRTFLFNRAVAINYYLDGSIQHEDIGVISSSWFGRGICIITLGFSILAALFPWVFSNKQLPARLCVVLFWITVVIIIFYFLFQP